jgi:hypothetical protein
VKRVRRLALPVAVVAATIALAPTGDALAAQVCAKRAVVRDSPGGFTVGYLYRRDRVRVVRLSANRRWARIVTPTELRGWTRNKVLCGRRR